jgi:hypothetical protein
MVVIVSTGLMARPASSGFTSSETTTLSDPYDRDRDIARTPTHLLVGVAEAGRHDSNQHRIRSRLREREFLYREPAAMLAQDGANGLCHQSPSPGPLPGSGTQLPTS